MEKLSESVRAYAYCLLSAQSNARSSIVGSGGKALDAQRIFLTLFEQVITSESSRSVEIERFQNVLKYARSKVDFNVAEGVYMLPSNMDLKIDNIENFNNKILVSKSGFKLGKNEEINQPVVKAFEGPYGNRFPLRKSVKLRRQPPALQRNTKKKKQLDYLWNIGDIAGLLFFQVRFFRYIGKY